MRSASPSALETDTPLYEELSSDHIIATVSRLNDRIADRFPGAGLVLVCQRLLGIAKQSKSRARWIARPVYWLRFLILTIVSAIVAVSIGSLTMFNTTMEQLGFADFVQLLDSGLNDILILGGGLFFVISIETRLKRRRALSAIHELRAVAHIIDMHQLTKDPERLFSKPCFTSETSPKLAMSQFELRRYLDYCSELLSLTGKVAALYVQEFDDGVALASASEVEELTTGLSQKIWQKIYILHTFDENQRDRQIIVASDGTS